MSLKKRNRAGLAISLRHGSTDLVEGKTLRPYQLPLP
jgi:hypothetical protein